MSNFFEWVGWVVVVGSVKVVEVSGVKDWTGQVGGWMVMAVL